MKNTILSLLMPILPKGGLSHLTGKFVHTRLPGPIGPQSVKMFADYYNINLDEAELPIEQYRSIGELFTRKLKPGIRPIGQGFVHPADSMVTQAGVISEMKCIQAKGKDYTLPEFLRNQTWAKTFDGGTFMTYYLCPTDYHRVHSPVDGQIVWSNHMPGELWPVNEWSVNAIANLFSVNERVAVVIDTPKGKVALVMVAATNVGNMKMAFDEEIATNIRGGSKAPHEKSYSPPKLIARGDEVGTFFMGSTVVMLYEKGMVAPEAAAQFKGKHVKMGQSIQGLNP